MVVLAEQTPLFALPLELRQVVYKAVLSSPLYGPELLRTCREIYLEAREFLFQRPLSFRGQLDLFDWLNQVPYEYLPQARVLSLNIQDVDLRSLLRRPALISHPGDPPQLMTWDLYEAELDRLFHALRQLSKVQRITIRAIFGRQSFLYREFLHKVLCMLGSLYPNLLDLALEGDFHHQDLSFLSSFTKLQAFSYDGFSASSPRETVRILSNLERLTSLSLISQNTSLTPDLQMRGGHTTKQQSFTGNVVNTIDNLTCFSVTEMIPPSAPILFFTPELLNSLHSHRSLQSINICLSQAPNHETMAALESFLNRTHIEILELDWPDLDPAIFETFSLFPEYLEKFWVRARSAANAFDIIWSFTEKRKVGNVRALTELVLVRSTPIYDAVSPAIGDRKDSGIEEADVDFQATRSVFDDTDVSNIRRAQTRLQALGVRVSWCTEVS